MAQHTRNHENFVNIKEQNLCFLSPSQVDDDKTEVGTKSQMRIFSQVNSRGINRFHSVKAAMKEMISIPTKNQYIVLIHKTKLDFKDTATDNLVNHKLAIVRQHSYRRIPPNRIRNRYQTEKKLLHLGALKAGESTIETASQDLGSNSHTFTSQHWSHYDSGHKIFSSKQQSAGQNFHRSREKSTQSQISSPMSWKNPKDILSNSKPAKNKKFPQISKSRKTSLHQTQLETESDKRENAAEGKKCIVVETHTDSVFDLTHYKPINQKKSQKTKKSIRNKQTTTDDFIDVKMDFILDENIRSLGSRPRTKSVVKYINSRSSSPRLMSNIIILLVDQWIANLSFVMKSQNYLRTQANCRQINRLLNLFLQCSRISNTNFPTKTPELRKRKRKQLAVKARLRNFYCAKINSFARGQESAGGSKLMGYDPVSLEILDPIHIQDRQKLALFFINLVMISEHNHVTPDKISHTFILKCSVVISARHYIYLNLWGSQFLSSRNTIQLVMFPGGELSKSKRRLAIPGSVVFFTKIHNSMNPWFSGLQLDRFIIQFRIPSSLILLIELMFNTRISSMNFVRSRFSDISLRARRSKTLNSLVIISSLCPETSQASSSIPMPETIRKITLLGIEWYIHLDRTIPLPLQHRLILSSAFEKMDALAFLIKDALISEIQTAYRQKISGKIGRPKYFDHAIFHVFLSIEMSHYCHVLWINNFFSVDPVDFTIANQISCRGSLSGANKNPSEAIHCTMSSNAYTRKNFNVTINSSSGDKLHTEAYDKNQLSKLSHKNTRTIKAPVKSPHFSSKKRAPKKKDKPRVSVGLTKLYSVISTPTQVFQPLKPNTKFPKNCRVGATIFRIPFPPLSDSYFGLIHEKLADDPFRLLIAVAFLNRTHGKAAIPVFYELMARYPTPESLLVARKEEIITLIRHLGLQNQRASTYLAYASTWLENPPVKEKRYAVRGYPYPDSGRDIKKGEILTYSDKREAWEIGHMTLGAYALDSWRIFCRDKLRGVAAGWNGEGAEKGFQPEWMRVLPQDKELKAFLQWMWLKEGFEWDSSTGEKEVARIELMRAALEGNIVWDDIGGMRVRYKGT